MPRAKRRADGTLRPAVLRDRRRRERAKRVAWLAEFDPGVRAAFFDNVDMSQARFARPVARQLSITPAEAEVLLEQLAVAKAWMMLRTRNGRVVGIGPRKR